MIYEHLCEGNDYRGIRVKDIQQKRKKEKKNQKSPRMDPDALQQTTAWPMAVHPESTESTESPRAICKSG